MRERLWLVLLLLVILPAVSACGARKVSTPAQPRLVVALLDVSGSTEAVRDPYLAQVGRIVESVPAGGRLVVLPISSQSLTAPAAIDITFPEYTWWQTNAFTHGRKMRHLQEKAMEGVTALFEQNPGTRGTALVDSLRQAQDFLKAYPEGAGALYIISDMVEQSDLLDMYSLEDADVESALAKVHEASRLPSLRGATVAVAGLEAAGHLPAGRILAIRRFWEQLFEAAGARLIGYSATLQLPDVAP